MVKNGDGSKPVWFTEAGWSSSAGEPGIPERRQGVTLYEQASHTAAFLELVSGRYAFVSRVYLYQAQDLTTGRPLQDHYGLFTVDLEAKPVVDRLRSLLREEW